MEGEKQQVKGIERNIPKEKMEYVFKRVVFPSIDLDKKPANKEFLPIKQKLVLEVLKNLNLYLLELFSLDGLKGKKKMQDIIVYIIKQFVAYIWDLPASMAYHHAEPFGLVKHSLETAYIDAYNASKEIIINDLGVPSSERTKLERPWRVFCSWLIGLCHDLGKIFDIDLFWDGETKMVYYHPLRGGVLDFKLKYPRNNFLEWKSGRGMVHVRRNMLVFLTIVPFELLKQMPPSLLIQVLDGLYSYKQEGDVESVKLATEEQNKALIIEAVQKLAKEGFKRDNKVYVYKIENDLYLAVSPIFFQYVADATKGVIPTPLNRKTVEKVFMQYNWVYTDEEYYYKKINVYRKDTKFLISASIISGDFFREAQISIPYDIKISWSSFEAFLSLLKSAILGGKITLKKSWFYHKEKEHEDVVLAQQRFNELARQLREQGFKVLDGEEEGGQVVLRESQESQEELVSKEQGNEEIEERVDVDVVMDGIQEEEFEGQVEVKKDLFKLDVDLGNIVEQKEEEKQKEEVKADKEKKEEVNEKELAERGLRIFIDKILDRKYYWGDLYQSRIEGAEHIGIIGDDGNFWVLYPKFVDQNFFELLGVDGAEDKEVLNKYRQKPLRALERQGFVVMFNKKGVLHWFDKRKALSFIIDGDNVISKEVPEASWVRLDLKKLIEFEPKLKDFFDLKKIEKILNFFKNN